MRCHWIFLAVGILTIPQGGFSGEIQFGKHDPKEPADFQSKSFNAKAFTSPTFQTSPAEFGGRTFTPPAASPLAKDASINGKTIETKSVIFNQEYAVKQSDFAGKSATGFSQSSAIPLRASRYASTAAPAGADKSYPVREYTGPEATRTKAKMDELRQGLAGIKGMPDRQLTIDEVKDLLNKDRQPVSPGKIE